jgi:hypothetical protein
VKRLIFGAFGDANPDFDVLVQYTVTTEARRHWRKMQESDGGVRDHRLKDPEGWRLPGS